MMMMMMMMMSTVDYVSEMIERKTTIVAVLTNTIALMIHCLEDFVSSSSLPGVEQLLVGALRGAGFGEERQSDVHAKRAAREDAR